ECVGFPESTLQEKSGQPVKSLHVGGLIAAFKNRTGAGPGATDAHVDRLHGFGSIPSAEWTMSASTVLRREGQGAPIRYPWLPRSVLVKYRPRPGVRPTTS